MKFSDELWGSQERFPRTPRSPGHFMSSPGQIWRDRFMRPSSPVFWIEEPSSLIRLWMRRPSKDERRRRRKQPRLLPRPLPESGGVPEKESPDRRRRKHGFKSFANRSRRPSIGLSPKTVTGAASETARARPNIGRDSNSLFWSPMERSPFRLS